MKQLGKKFTAVLLAAMMVLSLAVMASAATTQTAGTYSVTAQADKILFTRNGASASYPIKTANIKLTTHKDGDLLVCFTDSTGKARNVTVGKQTSLTLSGPMASLTLAKELNDGVAVTLGATANVTTMTVDTPNPVAINGKVGTLKVTAAANITLAKGATVTKKDVTSKTAKITTSANTAVTAAPTAAATKPAATKPAASSSASTGSKGDYRVKIDSIYWDEDEATLGDVLDELNDNLEVYDYATRTYLAGDARWTTSNNRSVQSGKSYTFTFTPDDKSYAPVDGSVKIYLDVASGEIDLELKSPGYLVAKDDDVKLKSLLSDLKKMVRAYDDNGDEVKGTVSWVSNGSNTIDNGRSYTYKFKPSSSRYESEEGKVYVYTEGNEP
ncbi:hypothetical protein [Anaerotruncus massiliensis (ex Togo et al. 2019)]|uniref:hypothetical protein n=2 Tax=Oscillospiraceae TaxID=216572 RepID=UPI000C76FA46|nr:hypothetical protein [Anaerotruncus massiliensis (ex Togo et al. 2019)]